MHKALTLMLLCLPLTILGCSDDDVKPALSWAPIVQNLAPVACPEIGARTRAEFAQTTARPKPDTINELGKPAVSKKRTQEWIDALEVSERRKNRAGQTVVGEHDRCRGDPPSKVS